MSQEANFAGARLIYIGLHQHVVDVQLEHAPAHQQPEAVLFAVLDTGDCSAAFAGNILGLKVHLPLGGGLEPADVGFAVLGLPYAQLYGHRLPGAFLEDKPGCRFRFQTLLTLLSFCLCGIVFEFLVPCLALSGIQVHVARFNAGDILS